MPTKTMPAQDECGCACHIRIIADRHDQRVDDDPRLAPAADIGDRAEERRRDRGRESAIARERGPQLLALHRIADHRRREIGREQIDRDEKDIGNAGPFEHRPGNLAEPAGDRPAGRGRAGRLVQPGRKARRFDAGHRCRTSARLAAGGVASMSSMSVVIGARHGRLHQRPLPRCFSCRPNHRHPRLRPRRRSGLHAFSLATTPGCA